MAINTGILIRDYQEKDLDAVQHLIHQTIDVCYPGIYPPRAVQEFKDFHSKEAITRRHEDGVILVVEERAGIVATGTLVAGDIFGVFVDPEVQGKGYGKAVMEELEHRAKARGREVVELSISLPSKHFYLGLGYRIMEDRSLDVGHGQRLDYWEAKKNLKERECQMEKEIVQGNLAEMIDYQDMSVVSKTLVDKKAGTVTLFAFDKGQGLSEHTAPFDAMVQVIDGDVEIMISGKPYPLTMGEMIVMPANEPHALRAVEKFKMLLTMIKK